MYFLVITKGKHAGNIFPLAESGPVVIGRSKECKIRILDLRISRRHCQIEARDNKFYIKDLGSTNKTIVNEKIIEDEVNLKVGDIIEIGDTALLFTDRKELSIRSVSEYEQFLKKQTMRIDLPPEETSP